MKQTKINFDSIDTDETKHHEEPVDISSDPFGWRRRARCLLEYSDDPTKSWCSTQGKPCTDEKRICWEECPVRRECLVSAISFNERYCIYGGYNHGQRRSIRSRWIKSGYQIPEFGKVMPDVEEVLKLILEASTYDPNNAPLVTDFEYDEPPETELLSIEAEESD